MRRKLLEFIALFGYELRKGYNLLIFLEVFKIMLLKVIIDNLLQNANQFHRMECAFTKRKTSYINGVNISIALKDYH